MGAWQDFWNMGGNIETQRTRGRADYERRQRGEGERPWWLSDQEWRKRQRQWKLDQAIESAPTIEDWQTTWNAKYQPRLEQMRGMLFDDTGAWRGPTFQRTSDVNTNAQYQQYQSGMADLIRRIQAGYTPEDQEAAFNQMASLYGMTPEEFRAMQSGVYNATPEQMQTRAEGMAMASTSMSAAFEAMIRQQQKSAMQGMGKQLENIFSERGGLGGFAAAYEMTNAIQDQFLQQRTQFIMDRYSEAMNAVNADLDRKASIVQSGQMTAQQFLQDRWGQLQTAFQDMSTASNQLLNEYAMRADTNRADFGAEMESFLAPFNAMKDQLMTELGIDSAMYSAFNDWYNANIMPYLDALAAGL